MKKIIISMVMLTMFTTPIAWAKQHHSGNKQWAKKTHVQPVTHIVTKSIQHKTYREKAVPNKHSNQNNQNLYHGTNTGKITKGTVGHKISNHKVDTVIGTLLGVSLGYHLSQQK